MRSAVIGGEFGSRHGGSGRIDGTQEPRVAAHKFAYVTDRRYPDVYSLRCSSGMKRIGAV